MIPEYSGVVFSQNSQHTGSVTSGTVYQDFFLPSDYVRGPDSATPQIPLLTGVQVAITATSTNIDLGWGIDHLDINGNWDALARGTAYQAAVVGEFFWISLFSDVTVTIQDNWLNDRFRFFVTLGTDVTNVYYTQPNPIQSLGTLAYTYPDNPIGGGSMSSPTNPAGLLFNIMALVADSDIDILGDRYRSIVVPKAVENIDTLTSPGIVSTQWMSRPNPSKYAVEAIYADISDAYDGPTVFDTILLDPITQGIQFNVYYSSDGDPVVATGDWDNKLWTHIPTVFTATHRDTYYMPRAVTARYVKVEFTNLQGQQYNPKGNSPIIYNKFPSWVVLYFLIQVADARVTEDYYLGNQQNVTFDLVNYAYNYYAGDITQQPQQPAAVLEQIAQELQTALETASQVDITTLSKISQNLFPYQSQPVLQGTNDYLPAISAANLGLNETSTNYPTEQGSPSYSPLPLASTGNYISSRIKDPLISQKTLQQMFFYITCRHAYQQVSAPFENNRAYFAGIRQLAFLRNNFSIPVDTPVYYETFGDDFNQVTF